MNLLSAKQKLFFNSAKITKIFWILAVRAFLIILIFILLDIIIGGYLFYKYAAPSGIQLANSGNNAIFKYDLYQQVLDEWQLIDKKFNEFPLQTQ